MKSPTVHQIERAASTVAEIARTEGLEEGVVVFHPKALTQPRWHPRENFEAPLSEVWVPVPRAEGCSAEELTDACRRKLEIAIEYRQDELTRMMAELHDEGSLEAERKVLALLYERPRVKSA